jgi:hypothetical protein
MSRAMPTHAYHRVATRQMVAGGVIAAGGALVTLQGTALAVAGAAFVVLGGGLAYLGLHSRRQTAAVLLNNAAFDLVGRGRISEAEALLSTIRVTEGNVRRAVETQRAVIALRRGDGVLAEQHANAAISSPPHWLTRHAEGSQVAMGIAIRAFARATQGKESEALADVQAVRAADATPESLARVALAEAVVLAKKDDRDALARVLRSAAPLVDFMAPRERSLIRALRRMVEVRPGSIYREAARPTEPSREEPLVGEWVSKILPEAAAFVPEAERSAETPVLAAPNPDPYGAPMAAGSSAIQREATAKATSRRGGRVVAVWAALVVLFLTIWQFLTPVSSSSSAPSERGAHHPATVHAAAEPTFPFALVSVFAVVVVAVFFGRIALGLRRARASEASLRAAGRKLGEGSAAECARQLEALAAGRSDGPAASAHLMLAALAERRGDLAAALRQCDAGLSRISRLPALRAISSDILVPELIAERAFVLAVSGDPRQADAELATLAREHPTFAYMTRSVFRVRLIQALRAGDRDGAVRLSRERTLELPVSRRDEMLADIVLATSGGRRLDGEVERLLTELAEDQELSAWIDLMAPGIRNALGALRQGGPRVNAVAPEPASMPVDEIDAPDAPDATAAALAAR